MSQAELADAASVARGTVQDFERGAHTPHPNHLDALRRALESHGVRFLGLEEGMIGVEFPEDAG